MIAPGLQSKTEAELLNRSHDDAGPMPGVQGISLSSVTTAPLQQDAIDEELFERWAWLYALCRERLFTSHVALVERVMKRCTTGAQDWAPVLVEVGCGPGFYARLMAQKFPGWRVIGIDRSSKLLQLARRRAASKKLTNCTFCHGDMNCADGLHQQADLLLASRLLFILADRRSALEIMYRSLRPGGSLLIAEPLAGFRSGLALSTMRILRSLGKQRDSSKSSGAGFEDNKEPRAIAPEEFSELIGSLHWGHAEMWRDRRYQYALCEKPSSDSFGKVVGKPSLVD